jgi:hypothetical protein
MKNHTISRFIRGGIDHHVVLSIKDSALKFSFQEKGVHAMAQMKDRLLVTVRLVAVVIACKIAKAVVGMFD